MSENATYDPLISLLEVSGVDYRLIDHESEGTTEIVSALRGHPSVQAAKCLVLIVKVDRRTTRYVPGDRRVDLRVVRSLYNARYAGFCDADTAQQLAQAVLGTVLPLAFDPQLELIADPDVAAQPQLYFNAARLDQSLVMSGADYVALARQRLERIAEPV